VVRGTDRSLRDAPERVTMREDSTANPLTPTRENVYTPVVKKNRVFKMDDETYEKLTAIANRFGMKRAAVLRLFIHEKHAMYRSHKMIEQ
jgi:hypothetical protein